MATSSCFRVRPYSLKKSSSSIPRLHSSWGFLFALVGILEGCCSRKLATITSSAYEPMPPWYTCSKKRCLRHFSRGISNQCKCRESDFW